MAKMVFNEVDNIDKEIDSCRQEVQSTNNMSERKYYKITTAEKGHKIRILPPLQGHKVPWYKVALHFHLMGKNGKQMALLCSMDKAGECPLCEDAARLREIGDKDRAYKTSAKDYFVYNVVDETGEFYILSADKTLQAALIEQFKFARSEEGGQFNPWSTKNGCWLRIIKTQTQQAGQKFPKNSFAVHAMKNSALDPSLIDAAAIKASKLDEIYRQLTPQQLELTAEGKFDPYAKDEDNAESVSTKKSPRDMDDDDDFQPVKKQSAALPKLKPSPKPADDDDVEYIPTKKTSKKAAPVEEDDISKRLNEDDDLMERADAAITGSAFDEE